MPDHGTLRQEESPAAQRKRIKAMAQDLEMQQVASTARPRGPERSPEPDTSDKQRMQLRLATMAKVAERDPEIEQRIRDREKAAHNKAGAKEPRRTRQESETNGPQQLVPVPAQWDDRHHAVLARSLANRAGGLRPLVRVLRSDVRQLPLGMVEADRIQTEPMPATLPGIEPVQPSPVPVLPFVAMFDRAGGTSMTRGRGAALGMRLYVETLLALPPELRRTTGPPVILTCTFG